MPVEGKKKGLARKKKKARFRQRVRHLNTNSFTSGAFACQGEKEKRERKGGEQAEGAARFAASPFI